MGSLHEPDRSGGRFPRTSGRRASTPEIQWNIAVGNSAHGIPREALASPAIAFKVVLINPYELGRQSFNLAAPAALLQAAGFDVACLALTLQKLDPDVLLDAGLVPIHLAMPTATRIPHAALPSTP